LLRSVKLNTNFLFLQESGVPIIIPHIQNTSKVAFLKHTEVWLDL